MVSLSSVIRESFESLYGKQRNNPVPHMIAGLLSKQPLRNEFLLTNEEGDTQETDASNTDPPVSPSVKGQSVIGLFSDSGGHEDKDLFSNGAAVNLSSTDA